MLALMRKIYEKFKCSAMNNSNLYLQLIRKITIISKSYSNFYKLPCDSIMGV